MLPTVVMLSSWVNELSNYELFTYLTVKKSKNVNLGMTKLMLTHFETRRVTLSFNNVRHLPCIHI